MPQNKALVYKKVPTELPVVGEHIAVEDWPLDFDKDLTEGSVLVKILYSSVDPYMRGRLREPGTKSYVPPFDLQQPLTTRSVVKVLKSAHPKFKQDATLVCMSPIAEYAILPKQILEYAAGPAKEIDASKGIDLPHYLGALGMPGLTAYSSYYEIGKPKKGDTIFVTAASGAVGQLVCQLAIHDGLHVIGSVGDDQKAENLKKDVGVEKVFNYKKEETADALKRLAPNGVDIFYDNVGGKTMEDALEAMNDHGRVVMCGAISQYNLKPNERYGVKNMFLAVGKQLKMQGFIVGSLGPPYSEEHQKNVSKWISEGTFKPTNHTTEGIETSGDALLSLFKGTNFGKAVIKM